jgi:hypothetical protein
MNAALHYYSAAQRQVDALRDSKREAAPQPPAEQAQHERRRARRLLLALSRG